MDVNEVYLIMQYIIAKNQNGYLSPDDFNLVINKAQDQYLGYLLGNFQSYQYGKPVAKVEFGMNEVVRQRLTPFIDTPSILYIDSTGKAPYPIYYQQTDAMYIYATMNRFRYVQQHKLFSYLNSTIDPVNTNPIFLIEKNGFQFYPNTEYNGTDLGASKISFVRSPNPIFWGSTLDVNGLPVYDPVTSTNPEWYDVDMLNLIARALLMVGINLQATDIVQYANEIKGGGQ